MRLDENERSEVWSVSRNETQISQALRSEICKSNFPIAKGYWKLSRKAEDMKPKACFGVHTRDL